MINNVKSIVHQHLTVLPTPSPPTPIAASVASTTPPTPTQATSAVPTWPVTVVNQIPQAPDGPTLGAPFWTLLGAVCAALITGCFLLWNEQRKRSRARADAELEAKRATELRFFTAVGVQFSSVFNETVRPDSSEMDIARAELQMTATQQLIEAGRGLMQAADYYALIHARGGNSDGAEQIEATSWFHNCRVRLLNEMRHERGQPALTNIYDAATMPKPLAEGLNAYAVRAITPRNDTSGQP